jgi:hypothetical protein
LLASAVEAGDTIAHKITDLVYEIGKRDDLLLQFIESVIRDAPYLLRCSEPAWKALRIRHRAHYDHLSEGLLASGHLPALHTLASSYWMEDTKSVTRRDVELFQRMAAVADPGLDRDLVRTLPSLQEIDHEACVALLEELATRADETILLGIADVLDPGMPWALKQIDCEDLRDITSNFGRLTDISNYRVQEVLGVLGRCRTSFLLDLLESRMRRQAEAGRVNERYTALPFHFYRTFELALESSDYAEGLQRVRDWAKDEDALVRFQAPQLFSEMAKVVEPDQIESLIRELLKDGSDEESLVAAVKLTQWLPLEQALDQIREIVRVAKTVTNKLKTFIAANVETTRDVVSGSLSTHQLSVVEMVRPWLSDPELKVRTFAGELISSLERSAKFMRERYEEWE